MREKLLAMRVRRASDGETHGYRGCKRGIVRGTIGGKGDATMEARVQVNCAVRPYYQVPQRASNTLQSRARDDGEALRANVIGATIESAEDASAPRLESSRHWL